uniref:Uncharacterized protein n=1 Tax=Ralstonia phage BOESR1 TaxID=3034917 RepID=A0AA49ENC2_9CAUD|nr:hypothetical protein HIBIKMCM_00007 [Ralstonia phage BOESR1]
MWKAYTFFFTVITVALLHVASEAAFAGHYFLHCVR